MLRHTEHFIRVTVSCFGLACHFITGGLSIQQSGKGGILCRGIQDAGILGTSLAPLDAGRSSFDQIYSFQSEYCTWERVWQIISISLRTRPRCQLPREIPINQIVQLTHLSPLTHWNPEVFEGHPHLLAWPRSFRTEVLFLWVWKSCILSTGEQFCELLLARLYIETLGSGVAPMR